MNITHREKPCILGVGEILWDMLPAGKQLGGAPANVAFHTRSLGADGIPVSAVGDDEAGKEIIETVRDLGLPDIHIAVLASRSTGSVLVTLSNEGVPDFRIKEDVAWDYIPWNDELRSLAEQADAVCYGSLAQRSELSRRTIRRVIGAADDRCLRVFDVNLRQSFYDAPLLQETMAMSDVLKLNEHELPVVASLCRMKGGETDVLRTLLEEYRLELIALTKGEKGSRLVSANTDSSLPGPAVTVADTVGAGDAFTAALIIGLLKHVPLPTVHSCASELAAYVCTREGATPQLTPEIRGRLKDLIYD